MEDIYCFQSSYLCTKIDRINWFVHRPSYFKYPGETSRIDACKRGKIVNSYTTNEKEKGKV
jgi:hypothetical protein